MTELEHIAQIKKDFLSEELNESDTRLKIIDTILVDVLKWPKSTITTEKYINGNRADYVLKNSIGNPLLIVESKRNQKYFELPIGFNNKNTAEKIIVEKLLTDENIKKAMFQVKEYAEDLLCNYACVTNGVTWIIYKVASNTKPWKKLPAFVIKNIDYFKENLTASINLLGYEAVVNQGSLTQNIGLSKKIFQEIFYPKNNIAVYNTPVNNNRFAGPLKTLSRKYLGQIPLEDNDFMEQCYVSNKGKYDTLQQDVQGFLHDSLTPYFENLGFRDFTDNKEAGAFGSRIATIVKKKQLNNVMILFGGRGAGKSTFIRRFLFHTKPIEISMYSRVALVPLLYSSQTTEQLANEIWDKVLNSIDSDDIKNGTREEILNLFESEFEVFKKQFLLNLIESDKEYITLINEFVRDKLRDTKSFCQKLSLKWKEKNKALVIFVDNMDQLPPELQDTCFLTATEISEKLGCLVIVSMREERYFEANSRGVLDAYQNPGFHLTSPVIPEVIIKRLDYILEKLKYTADIDTEFGIKLNTDLISITAFLEICRKELCRKDSPLSYFLRVATHGDVRQALEFFKGFLTSGYTNINEMAPYSTWQFQVHQVIKPMMIPERFYYDEQLSRIPNLYQLRNDTLSSHFTGLRIFQYLKNRAGDRSTKGFVDVKFLIHLFDTKYDSKDDCIKHLEIYLEKGLIEANNRLEYFSDEVNQVKMTALGSYIFEYLAFNFAYIDLVSLDCGLFNESLSNEFVQSAGNELTHYYAHDFISRIKLRIERANAFVKYLVEIENQEFQDLNLDSSEIKFTNKLKEQISEQEERIIKSAKNKSSETEYN